MRGKGPPSYAESSVHKRLLALFVIALSALFVLPTVASADYLYRGAPHKFGTAEGVNEQPRRAAVERSTNNLFVVEEVTGRVLVFKPSGLGAELLTEFGSGTLDAPYGIAIAESGGQTEVYVSDAGNEQIVRFSSDEQPTPSFTVDATYASPAQGTEAGQIESFASPLALAPDGDLWVADRGANVVKRFDDTGAHVAGSDFDGSSSPAGAFTGLLDIAANSAGDLYVVDTTGEIAKSEGTSRVERFAADGSHKATIGPLGPNSRSAIVAVNPSDDSVAVSGDQDGIASLISQPPVYIFDSSNAFVEEFKLHNDVQGGSFRGMVIVPGLRDTMLFSIGKNFYNGNETAGIAGVYAMSEAIPPSLTIEPATGVTASAATIEGEVHPHGVATTWQLEYRRSGAAVWSKAPSRDAGSADAPVAVSEGIDALLPAQQYEARIRATSVDGSSETSPVTFTTGVAPPRVVSQSASARTDGATLRAQINPGGEETDYHFEYGSTDSYGKSTPIGTIPGDTGSVNVSVEIAGLTPGASYHFRVVAENSVDDVAGADRSFTTPISAADNCPNAQYRTGPAAQLSDCRAYELVTPPGSEADVRKGGAPTTPDGGTACLNTEDSMVGSDSNGIKIADDGFCSWRGADGWETKWVTGPEPFKRFAQMGANVYFLSSDGERAIFASDQFILRPDYLSMASSSTTQMRSYMWEGGATRELSPPPPPLVIPGLGEIFLPESGAIQKRPLAASEDARRGIFQSNQKLLPVDTNGVADIYEWNPAGLRVVSTVDGSAAAAGGTPPIEHVEQLVGTGMISADGSRVFFHHKGVPLDTDAAPAEAPNAVQSVYMRDGDEVTLVSPRRGSGPNADVQFMAATSDGETVFVESTQQLTAEPKESGRAIYAYDVSGDELELFADRPGGASVYGISGDGSTVVYRDRTTNRMYVVRGDETTLLGTLADEEVATDNANYIPYRLGSYRPQHRALRITPDGSALVFAASGEFGGSSGDTVQIYRWSEDDGLQSISNTRPSGQSEDASIGAYGSMVAGDPREEFLANNRLKTLEGRVISEDGSRILFETAEGLVPRDQNGLTDVYEWHDGEVDLVTPGTGARAFYHDSSADGRTVFFTTYDRVDLSRDRNHNRDLYVAQPGGGFPPLPPPPSCEGEACQQQRPAPGPSGTGTHGTDEGNFPAAPKVAVFGKKQLKQLAKRGRTTIKVDVAAPGKVTALLKGRLKGRKATVAKATKTAKQAGRVRLTLRLSKRARKQLEVKGKLRLTLEVRHSRSDRDARKAVMLRG